MGLKQALTIHVHKVRAVQIKIVNAIAKSGQACLMAWDASKHLPDDTHTIVEAELMYNPSRANFKAQSLQPVNTQRNQASFEQAQLIILT